MSRNVETVQAIYAAFGRGDVAAIQARCTEDTEWGFNVQRSEVPHHAPLRSRAALPGFFAALQAVDFTAFEPRELVASGDKVAAIVHTSYRVKATGKTVDEDQIHLWTLDPEARVQRLVHFEDTAQVQAAFR